MSAVATLSRLLLWLASRLSRAQTLRLSRWLSNCSSKTESYQITRLNLATCFPQLNEEALKDWTDKSVQHTFLMFFEMAQLRHWPLEKLQHNLKVRGEAVLVEADAQGRGVLCLVPHLGNWEFLCAYLGSRYDLAALYDPPKVQGLETLIVEARERFQGKMYPIGVAGLRSAWRHLQGGGLLAVLPDQVPNGDAGVYADFYGHPALTMKLVDQLLAKAGPEPVLGWVKRVETGRSYEYEICFESLNLKRDPSLDQQTQQVLTATSVNKAIEKAINETPVQYQWEYKRFKRPRGQSSLYRRQ